MDNRSAPLTSLPVLIAAALFGGAVLFGLQKPTPETRPAAAASSIKDESAGNAASRPDPDPGPLKLVRDYFDYDAKKPDPKTVGYRVSLLPGGLWISAELKDKQTEPLTIPSKARVKFEFLIVTLPDPVDSKFALQFDMIVEAIQRAFQARGFILHSSRLPWKPDSVGKPAEDARHRYAPGALLFRKVRTRQSESERHQLCLVCLIGENPISGIQKAALTTALEAHDRLCQAACPLHVVVPGRLGPIPIVGPTFSGSQGVLRRTLEAWFARKENKETPPRFRIISGSATAVRPERFHQSGITFQATVIPNELVRNAVLDYLTGGARRIIRRDDCYESRAVAKLGRVAILGESNTGYGRQNLRQNLERSGAEIERGFIEIPFPVSISQVQIDLEKLTSRAQEAIPSIQPSFVTPKIPVRDVTQVDGIALYDREASVAIAADVLRDVLATIDREGVRYVGITASDSRDVVYLNKLLKKHCPSVRIFTTEPSAVLSLPAESYHMRGMIVGSTYSLYEPNQAWVDRELRRRLPFPSQDALGYYNAVLAQFGEYDQMLEYRAPDFQTGTTHTHRPPIWVSVIGQNGDLLPVAIYPEYDDAVQWNTADHSKPSGKPKRYVFDLKQVNDPDCAKYTPLVATHDQGEGKPAEPANPRLPEPIVFEAPPPPLLVVLMVMGLLVAGTGAYAAWRTPDWARKLFAGSRDASGATPGALVWVMRILFAVAVLLFEMPFIFVTLGGWEFSQGRENWPSVLVHGGVLAVVVALATYCPPRITIVVGLILALFGVIFAICTSGPGLRWVFALAVGTIAPACVVFGALGYASLGPWAVGSWFLGDQRKSGRWQQLMQRLFRASVLGRRREGRDGKRAKRRLFRAPDLGRGSKTRPGLRRARRLFRALVIEIVIAAAVFAIGAVLVIGIAGVCWQFSTEPSRRYFWLVRAMDLPSGLSPIVPIMFLSGVLVSVAVFHLRQVHIGRVHHVLCPFRKTDPNARDDWRHDLLEQDKLLQDQFASWAVWRATGAKAITVYVLGVSLFLFAGWYCASFHRTVEGRAWDIFMRALFWCSGAAVIFTLARLLTLWSSLDKLLDEIGKVRMARAFEQLPDKVGRLFRGLLYFQRPHISNWAVALQQLSLSERANADALMNKEKEALNAQRRRAQPKNEAEDRVILAKTLSEGAAEAVQNYLPALWDERSPDDAFGRSDLRKNEPTADDTNWRLRAEGFVATVVVLYLCQFFVQLRQLALALTFSSPLLLMAAASYPFQPERPLIAALVVLLIAVMASILYVLYDVNRNELVSRITRTVPNQFTPDRGFLSSAGTYVLPILLVLLAHVFGLIRFILEPILGSIR